MDDRVGESIWDISSWEKDLHWKEQALRNYFDAMEFGECIHNVLSLADEYFESVFKMYEDEEEGSEIHFAYLEILVFISEEYIYGHYYYGVSPLQELQLVETVCLYFQSKPLDPVRHFVFDCLFGIPTDNLEIQKGFLDHKMNVIIKLASMAVGVGCGNVLNCVAVWMHTYGFFDGRAARLASSIVNDYCSICPRAVVALRDLIHVSPVFAHQFVLSVADHYAQVGCTGESDKLPPVALVDIVASWIVEQPQFCTVGIPSLFLQLPSIHKYRRPAADRTSPFFLCPIFKVANWCFAEPLRRRAGNEDSKQEIIRRQAYSKLMFGLLNYVSLQKKVEPTLADDPDDLEPGELLEESEVVELLSQADVMSFVVILQKMLDDSNCISDDDIEASVNRLAQLVQLCCWAGSISAQPAKLQSMLELLPQTKLLVQVVAGLKSNSVRFGGKLKRLLPSS